ncbi:MAG: DUF4445 domain-containing protein [Coriobacteriia bacterium]|nr:DUF4445 domain-containing protein [Coriobacteriia bacterium]
MEEGTTLLSAARSAGAYILATCAGRKACGTCAVRVLEGKLGPISPEEQNIVGKSSVRLACRARVIGDVVVMPISQRQKLSTDVRDTASSTDSPLVVGVDFGTTSIALDVFDLERASVIAVAHSTNAQNAWGADVLSRLSIAVQDRAEMLALRDAAQNSILEALSSALLSIGREPDAVERMVIGANTVVASLLCGTPAHGLAHAPFLAPEEFLLSAGPLHEALLAANPSCEVHVVAPLRGFVGGDIVCGLFGADVLKPKEPVLFVDIGTNVEFVAALPDKIIVGSAPAGSAFAASGGLGSSVLEKLLQLRERGILDESGLLDATNREVFTGLDGVMFVEDGKRILTQLQIRDFQLAKAAVGVGVEKILHAAHIGFGDLSRVIITGAFGNALNAHVLFGLKILPSELVGVSMEYRIDAALDGATMIARGFDGRFSEAGEYYATAEVVDFVADPGFANELMDNLSL